MTYLDIANTVAKDLNLPKEVVIEAYKSYWKFIRETIQKLPLRDIKTEEDFNKYKTNFNIPSLGKLSCTYPKLIKVHNKFNYFNKIKDNVKNKKDSTIV